MELPRQLSDNWPGRCEETPLADARQLAGEFRSGSLAMSASSSQPCAADVTSRKNCKNALIFLPRSG
jgi:hypothetical protein